MRLLFAIVLFFSLQSNGQVINASKAYRPFSVASCTNKLLDDYSGAVAAYSLRKLDCDYAGAAIRVRESGGNTESDIGFTANGDLDTATLKTFVGANNGYIVTFYDQISNKNATQSNASKQNIIVASGVVVRENGKPAIDVFQSDNYLSIANSFTMSDYTVFWVSKKNDNSASYGVIIYGGGFWSDDADNAGNPAVYLSSYYITGSNTSASGGEVKIHLSYSNRNSDKASGGLNGEVKTEATVTTSNMQVSDLFRYVAYPPYGYVGKIQEIIIYNSNKKSNRADIESNINSYYSLY